MKKDGYILGVDEVGRGSLAGPVTVGVVCLPRRFYFSKKLPELRDSKKMSERSREILFDYIKEDNEIDYDTSYVTPEVIDRININESTNLAATRAVKRLIKKNNLESDDFNLYVDGYIKLNLDVDFKNVIGGDDKINAIKAASVVAKVTRDRKMIRNSKKISKYGFEDNKGYGTKYHRIQIEKYGPSEMHRLTFLN